MSRRRFTTSPLQVIEVDERCWDNTHTDYYSHIDAFSTPAEEIIIDEPGPARYVQGGMGYKNLSHTKFRCKINTGSATFLTGRYGSNVVYCSNGVARCVAHAINPLVSGVDLGKALHTRLIAKVPDATTGFNDRWLRSKPSMSTRANLAVSLWELGDVKRMFDVLPVKHFNRSWRDVQRELFSARYWNGLHLNYNFGWKPFIADVKNVFRGMSTFEHRLERFLREAGQDLRIHAQDQSSLTGVETIRSPDQNLFEVEFSYRVNYTLGSTFCLRYTLPDYGYNELRWRSHLDTLGLKVNPENVWAVLPWSFVVDWFFDIGGYLGQYSSDWVEPNLALIQACTSVKATAHADIKLKYVGYNDPFNTAPVAAGTIDTNVFVRKVRFPEYMFKLGTLDADKIRLLASLAGARIF